MMRDRTDALLHIARGPQRIIEREKSERGLLDYDDLIDKTLAMLERRPAGCITSWTAASIMC